MGTDHGTITNHADRLFVRYWVVAEEKCCKGLSLDDFYKKIVIPISEGSINKETFKSSCIDEINAATISENQQDVSASHKANALYCHILFCLSDLCEGLNPNLSNDERWGKINLATERITKIEMLEPLNGITNTLEQRIKYHFSRSGVKARGDFEEAKTILRRKLSELHIREGKLHNIQYAINKVAESVVKEFNLIPTIKKKLSSERVDKTMRTWISNSDMLQLFFAENVVNKLNNLKNQKRLYLQKTEN